MNIAICDDDAEFLNETYKRIENIIKAYNHTFTIVQLHSDKELIEYCHNNYVDIIVTDIDMPDSSKKLKFSAYEMEGFEAAKELQAMHSNLEIIFLTAHEELAYQSYRYKPFSFVSKRDMQMLDEDLTELIEKLEQKRLENLAIPLTIDKKTYMIDKKSVIYFKSDRHYISAYTKEGKEKTYRLNINEAYKQLSDDFFIYVHRSYLINCRFIDFFDTKNILLSNGEKISVTRNEEKLKNAQIIFSDYKRSLR